MSYDNSSALLESLKLGYHVQGEGSAQAVVLLHGLNSHSGTWRKTIPLLSTRAYVIAPSLPRHNGAISPSLVESYVGQVKTLLSGLKIKNATIVGNSLGGWIAMHLLSKSPELVSKLVLEDTAGSNSEDVAAVDKAGIPVLIIWGRLDELLPVSMAYDLQADLAKSELRIFDDVGHVPHWEAPEKFNELIEEFVGREDSGA